MIHQMLLIFLFSMRSRLGFESRDLRKQDVFLIARLQSGRFVPSLISRAAAHSHLSVTITTRRLHLFHCLTAIVLKRILSSIYHPGRFCESLSFLSPRPPGS